MRHRRSFALYVGSGILLFVGLMIVVNLFMISLAGNPASDGTMVYFYALMAGAGALFGFELWWSHEQGPVNPFHESRNG